MMRKQRLMRKLKMRNLGLSELRMTRQAKRRLRDGMVSTKVWKFGGYDLELFTFGLMG